MKRRAMLSASALALLAPGSVALAAGAGTVEYSKEIYEQALASGEPFMLDFFAPW